MLAVSANRRWELLENTYGHAEITGRALYDWFTSFAVLVNAQTHFMLPLDIYFFV
jgi:hypothetical protein